MVPPPASRRSTWRTRYVVTGVTKGTAVPARPVDAKEEACVAAKMELDHECRCQGSTGYQTSVRSTKKTHRRYCILCKKHCTEGLSAVVSSDLTCAETQPQSQLRGMVTTTATHRRALQKLPMDRILARAVGHIDRAWLQGSAHSQCSPVRPRLVPKPSALHQGSNRR
jgi:hypothetical protein